MLLLWKTVVPTVPFGRWPSAVTVSKSVLLPPKPCSITIVGKGPSPPAGSVTSTSSGTPSKLATRCESAAVGQKRTPPCGAQACPNGSGGAAWAAAGAANAATTAAKATRVLIRFLPCGRSGAGRGGPAVLAAQ